VAFQRLTDRLEVNESPAISPDGRMVAFVAPVAGRRQIWVRLLSGGAPLQITSDDNDHGHPRWTANGSAIVYFAAGATASEAGTLMEVSALGGQPRPLMSALNGADVSHDGRRLAMFQARDGILRLVIVSRESGQAEQVTIGPRGTSCDCPRWSPDDRWIAFQAQSIGLFTESLYVVRASRDSDPQLVARAADLRGVSWLPDGTGLVYSSSAGSGVLYPPTFNLRRVGRDGRGDAPMTFGDISYVEPDVHASGTILACRIRAQSDIWKFPVGGPPADNMRGAVRITRQSGQVQVPSVSPDGSEVVYLSDNGGHGNLWVAKTDGTGAARQITFEQDPGATMGLPVWSPVDNRILFVVSRELVEIWMVQSDGRGLHQVVPRGVAPCWSPDAAWIYYLPLAENEGWNIVKIPSSGGPVVGVRNDDNSHAPVAGRAVLYYATRVQAISGMWDWEFWRASPEDGPSELLTRLAGARIPVSSLYASMTLSPDGRWLARTLLNGATSNIVVLSVDGGPFIPVTDFGDRPTVIARSVSWSPDGSIYAAVADTTGDVVVLDGLI
jgi:Tol biopolymer transport system component